MQDQSGETLQSISCFDSTLRPSALFACIVIRNGVAQAKSLGFRKLLQEWVLLKGASGSMTTTYQLAPYLLWIKPAYSHGDIRPIDDIDLNGLTMQDLLARTLAAVLNKPLQSPKRSDTEFKVVDVMLGERCLYFEVTVGSSGIESEITAPDDDQAFSRTVRHVENVRHRNIVVFPEGGEYAILMTERIGTGGVSSFTERLFKDTIQENLKRTIFSQKALLSAAELGDLPIMVNSVSFEFPQQRDEQGRLTDMGVAAGKLHFRLKLTRARKLVGFTKGKGKGAKIDPSLVYGVIDESLQQAGFGFRGKKLMKAGVRAKVGVELPSGNKRSFTVGEREGPALVYSLGKVEAVGEADQELNKPGNDVLVNVARDILTDVKGNYGVRKKTVDYCVLPATRVPIEVPKGWKEVWRGPNHSDSGSS